MKICFLVENIKNSGGIPRVVSLIANALSLNDENKVTILSIISSKNNKAYFIRETINCEYLFKQNKINYKIHFCKISNKLRYYWEKNFFDVIIIAGMDFVPFCMKSLKKLKKTQMIGWEHSNFSIGKKYGMRWWGRRLAAYYFDCIIVLTDRDKKMYKKGISRLKAQIIRIYNPIDEKIKDTDYQVESRKMVSVGALIPQKGFDYAIMAAKYIFKKHPDWGWEIWGEGEEKYKLQSMIEEYNLQENVKLMGFSSDIYNLYKEYSFYVLTSRYEGFCMVNLEAQKNKLPIIAFDCPCGPEEIILDKENGLLVNCFDIVELAEKICYLIENPEERIRMSKNCEKTYDKFGIEKIILSWKKVLNITKLEYQ